MKNLLILIFIVLLGPLLGHGQHLIKNQEELNGFNAISNETVFVHFNDNFLLAGEYLYYKINCLNAKDLRPSKISKIGYVELVGKNGESVFKHKIGLTSGVGQGDFLIPVNVNTGHYKLTGYTQWMLNKGKETIFIADVIVVNPYQELPNITATTSGNSLKLVNKNSADHPIDSTVFSKKSRFPFEIDLSKKTFGKRSSVKLKIVKTGSDDLSGTYSISVRKKNLVELPPRQSASNFASNPPIPQNTNVIKITNRIYLPELRGELVSGKIVSNTDGSPVSGQTISLSISGNNGIVKISRSDVNGVFYFNLDGSNRKSDIILELSELGNDESKIILDSVAPLNLKSAHFKDIIVSQELNPMIRERSIYNQVERAFFEQKADSILDISSGLAVFRNFRETYVLDDYKRFKTLRETLVEIIENVFIKKIKGKLSLQVRSEDQFFVDAGDTPMLLVDGIMVQDLNKLLAYDIKKIDQINISRNEYYFGPKRFQGIVSIDTKQNDFAQQMETDNLLRTEIDGPLPLKKYYFQDYSKASQADTKHIADFRHQLLWQPKLELNQETLLEFFTSDNTGEFEIILEGFTALGQAVSLSETIHVE